MASTTTSLLSSHSGQDAPSWVLLDISGYVTTSPRTPFATSATSTGKTIQVSFSIARPPNVSHFCVHCPDLAAVTDFTGEPKVISAEGDLILFRLSFSRYARLSMRHYDYFVYRAHPQCPSLVLLPNPDTNIFLDNEVALVRCSDDGEYAIAALRNKYYKVPLKEDGTLKEPPVFMLCVYRSSKATEGWSSEMLSVAEPVRDRVYPVEDTARYHHTTKVITLGGPRGTVGWVDLWRGIIVCDVLDEKPVLQDVPLPPPARGNREFYHKRCSYIFRDIAVSRSKDRIKYIELENGLPRTEVVSAPPDTYLDWFQQKQQRQVHHDGWKAWTWSMPIPIPSRNDWSPGCTVNQDEIVVEPMYSKLLLLLRPSGSISEPFEATLLQLTTAFPTISMDDDVFYLLATGCPTGHMDVVIAVDLRKKKVLGVGNLTTGKDFKSMRSCTTEISKYLNLNTAAGKRDEEKQTTTS